MVQTESPPAAGDFAYAFRVLRVRDYRNYWFSGLGMTGTQGITQLALVWLVVDLTGSVGQLGVVIFMQGVAWTIVALIGGVLADRYSRRNLLITSQAFTMASLAAIIVLTMADLVQVWQVYLSSLIFGSNQALMMPARTAIMRSLVDREDMLNAVVLNSMQQHSTRVVGPTLLAGSACSLVAIALLLRLRNLREYPRPTPASPLREMLQGIQYSFSTPVLRLVMTINFAVAFFGLAYLNMGPGFARQVLNFSASETGFFVMASGIGSIFSSVGLVFYDVLDKFSFVTIAKAAFGLSLLALCLNPWLPGAFLIMVLFGLANSTFAVTAQTIFQTAAEPRYLGHVISLWSMGGGIGALTALPIGLAGDEFGLRWSLGLVAAALVATTALIFVTMLPAAKRAGPEAAVLSQ